MIDFCLVQLKKLNRIVKSDKKQEGVRIKLKKAKLKVEHEWSDISLGANT